MYIFKLVDTLHKAQDIIQSTELPSDLEFLKEEYEYQLVPDELTIIGRKELFDHGVEFIHYFQVEMHAYSGSKECPNVCMFFTKVDNP